MGGKIESFFYQLTTPRVSSFPISYVSSVVERIKGEAMYLLPTADGSYVCPATKHVARKKEGLISFFQPVSVHYCLIIELQEGT
jgi:hypothetical protein